MAPVLDLLVETLVRRFSASGFDVPQSMTGKERESFVINTLETAAILPQHLADGVIESARRVVNSWEQGDLAAAVRNLSSAIETTAACVVGEPRNQQVFIICQGGLVQEVVGLSDDRYEICDCDSFEDRDSHDAEEYFDGLSTEMKNYLRRTGWNKELPLSRRDTRGEL
jgi:hypothetical protein